jgi:hypothetical protein
MMKREYTTGSADSITFFVGDEIEKTPAYGMKTLFVVGVHTPEVIIDLIEKDHSAFLDTSKNVNHIYFGANQSFAPAGTNDIETWKSWEDMIQACLVAGYWCTLDFDVKDVEGLLESGLTEQRRFIPQLSVKIPYLTQLGYNATIKIDDIGFDATNPGVWCHQLNRLTTSDSFTNWDQYSKDEILK